ncbi:MAG: glycosyltransferase family 39 protein, partial [Gemmatimonadetes bacterium]|nr:glycosyltransferase family 39 protein [Gemmatimonadota bacterium]
MTVGTSALLALLVALIGVAGIGRVPAMWLAQATRLLGARSFPWALGLISALLLGWVGGRGLAMTPISTDENAYLLEARLLAHGRIAGDPAPIPDFFEQPWVMVTPRTYAKYPPGQSLILAPGVAIGLPWLVPALLLVATGALIFLLARRIAGPGGALLTWGAWVLTPMTMAWQSSYFSEITSAATWLVALWTYWRWHDGGGRRWLVFTALALGAAAVTRPFTALLLGGPIVVLAAIALFRRRAWGDALRAGMAGVALLAILPAWNHATTGKWTVSPLSEYTATYLPWDRLGFAIDSSAPRRPPAADFAPIATHLLAVHRDHTLARLPATLLER